MNNLNQIKKILYELKKQYGAVGRLYKQVTNTVDPQSGQMVVTYTSYLLKKLVLLPASLQRIAGTLSTTGFNYGGLFDSDTRILIIDKRELLIQGFDKLDLEDHCEFRGTKYQFKNIETLDQNIGYLIVAKRITNSTLVGVVADLSVDLALSPILGEQKIPLMSGTNGFTVYEEIIDGLHYNSTLGSGVFDLSLDAPDLSPVNVVTDAFGALGQTGGMGGYFLYPMVSLDNTGKTVTTTPYLATSTEVNVHQWSVQRRTGALNVSSDSPDLSVVVPGTNLLKIPGATTGIAGGDTYPIDAVDLDDFLILIDSAYQLPDKGFGTFIWQVI